MPEAPIKGVRVKTWNLPSAALDLAFALAIAGTAQSVSAQATTAPYRAMAPRDQYMMEKTAEMSLARSAGPSALSSGASVLVLGPRGFETAATGANHFTCLVERSWDKPFDDPEFWNQKMRGPICMNEAAVHTVLPMIMERAEWALAGFSRDDGRTLENVGQGEQAPRDGRHVLHAIQRPISVRRPWPSLVSTCDVLLAGHR